jgi:hypothetical protein
MSTHSDETIRLAWYKTTATVHPEVRIDCDGRYISWSEYGQYTEYGWQIDHILPRSLLGSDSPDNLRARHWRGNSYAGGLLGMLTGGNALKV